MTRTSSRLAQRKLLVALAILESRGTHPTWGELSHAAGLSRQKAHYLIPMLREKRLVTYTDEQPCSIRITDKGLARAKEPVG